MGNASHEIPRQTLFALAGDGADAKVMQGYSRVLEQRTQVCESEAIAALADLTLGDKSAAVAVCEQTAIGETHAPMEPRERRVHNHAWKSSCVRARAWNANLCHAAVRVSFP